jgi:hypothetical protein
MIKGLRFAEALFSVVAILSLVMAFLWFWVRGLIGMFRRRYSDEDKQDYRERDVLGGTMRIARSGPMFSASWTPNTGPAYLFMTVLSCVVYIAFMLFGFHPALIAAFTVIAAVTCINQMRRKIGLGNPYARAATAMYLATIIITFAGLIFQWTA